MSSSRDHHHIPFLPCSRIYFEPCHAQRASSACNNHNHTHTHTHTPKKGGGEATRSLYEGIGGQSTSLRVSVARSQCGGAQ